MGPGDNRGRSGTGGGDRGRAADGNGDAGCSPTSRARPGCGDHQRAQLARRLEPASAALGRDVLAAAADDVAGGRAMTFDQVLDYAAAWADQRSRATT
ncbi:MAG TPA: hypothetical protein VG411_16745 [Actinomycetota bacterium]|nr:hypothetical protein [Actinomycetota bacterium]